VLYIVKYRAQIFTLDIVFFEKLSAYNKSLNNFTHFSELILWEAKFFV